MKRTRKVRLVGMPGTFAHEEVVGNPVREAVLELRTLGYPPFSEDGVFRLLVSGGSQGASIFADIVPDALALMPLPESQATPEIQSLFGR